MLGHTDDERVVTLSRAAAPRALKVGDHLLFDPRTQYAFEKMPKSAVEEVALEEIPDVTYDRIGGLGDQIEILRDAIELPYMHPDVFAEHSSPAEGHPALRPAWLRQDPDRQGGGEQPRQEHRGEDTGGRPPPTSST